MNDMNEQSDGDGTGGMGDMNDQMNESNDQAENAETHERAGEWSDADFEAALDAVERGEPLLDGIPADTAEDLAVARRLFAQRANAGEALASRAFADAPAAISARSGDDWIDGTAGGGRFGFSNGRRWLPEAAVLLVVLGLGAAVVTQLPRITGGPSGEARSTDVAGGEAAATATPVATGEAVAEPVVNPYDVPADVSDGTPVPAYPPPEQGGTRAYTITGQVVFDRTRSRLYALGEVEGNVRVLVIEASDGTLIGSFNALGGLFALDEQRGLLIFDGFAGMGSLKTVDLATYERREIAWPPDLVPTVPANPISPSTTSLPSTAPLFDPKTGNVLVFRGNRMLVVDANPGSETPARTMDFDVRGDGSGNGSDLPPPITSAILDPDHRILYLDFITSSTPTRYHTLVAHDLESGKELGRVQGSSAYTAVAEDSVLYASSWNRMSVRHNWMWWIWKYGQPVGFSDNWGGYPIGVAYDPGRQHVYVATTSQLREFDAGSMLMRSISVLPFQIDLLSVRPPSLVGYDPGSDRLYFVVDGRLEHMSVADLEMPPAVAPVSATPPSTAVRELHFSPRWPVDQTVFGIWNAGTQGPACDTFGQTGGQLFISGDAGQTWKRAPGNLGAICDRVSALAALPVTATDRPPILLAGVPGLGIFRSEDSGAWWHPSGAGLNNAGVAQLRKAPGDEGTIFAAGPLGELHVSAPADKGRIWRSLGPNLPVFDISPDFGADGTLLGAGNTDQDGDALDPALQVSRDRGTTGQRVGPVPDWPDASRGVGVEMLSIAPLFAKRGMAFLYHTDGALYRTADGGQTWAKVLDILGHPTATPQIVYGPEEESQSVYLITATSDNPARDPASGRLRYFRSGDGGQTWDEVPVDIDGAPSALAPAPNFAASGRLFVGTADGRVLEETLAVR